jgi:hypothetical protein
MDVVNQECSHDWYIWQTLSLVDFYMSWEQYNCTRIHHTSFFTQNVGVRVTSRGNIPCFFAYHFEACCCVSTTRLHLKNTQVTCVWTIRTTGYIDWPKRNVVTQTQWRVKYKVVQIWPGQTVTCLHTNSPGHIWTTLYLASVPKYE